MKGFEGFFPMNATGTVLKCKWEIPVHYSFKKIFFVVLESTLGIGEPMQGLHDPSYLGQSGSALGVQTPGYPPLVSLNVESQEGVSVPILVPPDPTVQTQAFPPYPMP